MFCAWARSEWHTAIVRNLAKTIWCFARAKVQGHLPIVKSADVVCYIKLRCFRDHIICRYLQSFWTNLTIKTVCLCLFLNMKTTIEGERKVEHTNISTVKIERKLIYYFPSFRFFLLFDNANVEIVRYNVWK